MIFSNRVMSFPHYHFLTRHTTSGYDTRTSSCLLGSPRPWDSSFLLEVMRSSSPCQFHSSAVYHPPVLIIQEENDLRTELILQHPPITFYPSLNSPVFEDRIIPDTFIKFSAYCLSKVVESTPSNYSKQLNTHNSNDTQNVAKNKNERSPSCFDGTVSLLNTLRRVFRIRVCELVTAFCLIDRIINKESGGGVFVIDKNNAFMTLLVAVILSHKMMCDKPYSNKSFSSVVKAHVQHVNSSELFVLSLLEHNLTVDSSLYQRYCTALLKE
ncbi:hypothetical protein BLNAU_6972 [Blattamonas nauphoetae]|uniref:Cyclin N-terminal domain-containing protein n=1 Tax=Blattamonas nauphoetae TaxID=2049346 RepID=A0ABQ9Y2S4_9EUKA|nr:hypothetical protein BLNAU_6972 [Blattamonas nauphoetae]